nr:hypothetical protein [uncultured Lachnoclostridium sp.]
MIDKNKKQVINGMLADYYVNIPRKLSDLDTKAKEERSKVADVKAVSMSDYSSTSYKTHDQKLADMITNIDKYKKTYIKYQKKQQKIFDDLNITYLTSKEQTVLEAVFKSRTYKEAGKKIGYTKTQVYRIMEKIYERMQNYI